MCKNNTVSQHVLKYNLSNSELVSREHKRHCLQGFNLFFFIEHKRSRSHYNLGLYAHRAVVDKAYPDAGSPITGTAGEREGLTRSSLRGG